MAKKSIAAGIEVIFTGHHDLLFYLIQDSINGEPPAAGKQARPELKGRKFSAEARSTNGLRMKTNFICGCEERQKVQYRGFEARCQCEADAFEALLVFVRTNNTIKVHFPTIGPIADISFGAQGMADTYSLDPEVLDEINEEFG